MSEPEQNIIAIIAIFNFRKTVTLKQYDFRDFFCNAIFFFVTLHSETRPKDSLTGATLSAKPEGDERREVKSGDGISKNLSRYFPHMYVHAGCK